MKDQEEQSGAGAVLTEDVVPTRRKMTAWQSVAEALVAEGVNVLFGLPSDPPQLYDDLEVLHKQGRIRVVGVRHEVSGPFMAMAYARVTGRPAACYASSGPGVANLVTGVLEAYSGCTPMIVLGVRAPRTHFGMGAFQELDQVTLLRSITKWATTVETAELVPWTLRRALQIATTGRPGPVYVELPADLGAELAEIPEYEPAPARFRPGPDGQAVLAAAKLIAAAKRPLIITGGGTVSSGAGDAVTRFAHKFGMPIQTTPGGRGSVAETDPLFCGLVGLYRTAFPKKVYEAADLHHHRRIPDGGVPGRVPGAQAIVKVHTDRHRRVCHGAQLEPRRADPVGCASGSRGSRRRPYRHGGQARPRPGRGDQGRTGAGHRRRPAGSAGIHGRRVHADEGHGHRVRDQPRVRSRHDHL